MSEQQPKKTSFIKEIFERRVPQVTGLYLGAGWGVVEFVQYLVSRYGLSPHLEEISLVVLLSLIPSVCVVVYYHGKGDWEKWSRVEIFGIPINLLLTCFLLFSLFQGKDLGATTTRVVLKDEQGVEVERVVAKSSFRKRVALFSFKNNSGDPSLDWLSQAVPGLVHYDLLQDMFIKSISPLLNEDLGARIKKSGFDQGQSLPIALCRQLADDYHMPYFLTGAFTVSDGNYSVNVQLYETANGKRLTENSVQGADLFHLADQLVVRLKEDLDIPKVQLEQAVDLPVAELLTPSMPALKAMTMGLETAYYNRDLANSQVHFQEAVDQDPNFAFSWLILSSYHLINNNPDQARACLAAAERFSFKLPELIKFQMKALRYTIDGEPEKRLNLLKMQVELFPENIQARETLADLLVNYSKPTEAIAQYLEILELSPEPHLYFHTLGKIYHQIGQPERALSYYQKYAERFPKDADSFSKLGQFYERSGDYVHASENYEKAAFLNGEDLNVQIDLADVTFHSGQFDPALTKYEAILAGTTDPVELRTILEKLARYYLLRGQLEKAVETKNRFFEVEFQTFGSINVFVKQLLFADTMVESGRVDESLAIIKKIEAEIKPPFDNMVPLGYFKHYLALKDLAATRSALTQVLAKEESLSAIGLGDVMRQAQASFFELSGEIEKALEILEPHAKANPGNVGALVNLARCYRKLDRWQEAKAMLTKVLPRVSYNGKANYEMAIVLAEIGEKEKAISYLNTSLTIWAHADTQFKPAQEARDLLKILQTR